MCALENRDGLVGHLFKVRLVSGVNVFVAVSVNSILVRFLVGQEVGSVAALQDASGNHFRGDELAVVDPSDLGKEVDEHCADVVVADVAELARSVVVGEHVVIVVVTAIPIKRLTKRIVMTGRCTLPLAER